MTHPVADHPAEDPIGARFRAPMARPGNLRVPGACNGLSGLHAMAAGSEASHPSGDKKLAPADGMAAARKARRCRHVVARTDAVETIGCDGYGALDASVVHSPVPGRDAG